MIKVLKPFYKCELCGHSYSSEQEAFFCESKPIDNASVKVGDVVIVLSGQGKGEKAVVQNLIILDKDWGHYAAARYWHTVMVEAKMIESFGMRALTFDDYRKYNG